MSSSVSSSPSTRSIYFAVEYYQGCSKCQACMELLSNYILVIGIREKKFDKCNQWYHQECFWELEEAKILLEQNTSGIEFLDWEHQEYLFDKIIEVQQGIINLNESKTVMDYAVPSISIAKPPNPWQNCEECFEEIRGIQIKFRGCYFHPRCLDKQDTVKVEKSKFNGFEQYGKHLGNLFSRPSKRVSTDTSPLLTKKPKIVTDSIIKEQLKTQAEIRQKVIERIKGLSMAQIETLLKKNGRLVRCNDTENDAREQLADIIIYGIPSRCYCSGMYFYNSAVAGYKCRHDISPYLKCNRIEKNPSRLEFVCPVNYQELFTFDQPLPLLNRRYYGPYISIQNMGPLLLNLPETKSPSVTPKAEKARNLAVVVKNNCLVDPRFEFFQDYHVYIHRLAYQAHLSLVNIDEDVNKVCKIQLLEHDTHKNYYLFRAYGNLGSENVSCKYFEFDLKGAMKEFAEIFHKYTGNFWGDGTPFVKKKGKYDLNKMVHDGTITRKLTKHDVTSSKSKLSLPVKQLLTTILDIEVMENTLKQFNLDMEKMPIGHLSKDNIHEAMVILRQLQKKELDEMTSRDLTSRFYHRIPHLEIKPLNNPEIIAEKYDMLKAMADIEIAYSILSTQNADSNVDPIDANYAKLKCQIETLSPNDPNYKVIHDFFKIGHSPRHDRLQLEILDIFKIIRDGEADKFKKELGNRHLLWHGSRTCNFARILQQGLRIAPPDVHRNGDMFGKGIYFADLVTKSAGYCSFSYDSEGYLLLCEVALGAMQEEAENLQVLKKGMNSVKGLGKTIPTFRENLFIDDGITVPFGTPMDHPKADELSLLHNEYIVYDEAQVKLRYLIRAKFL